MEWRTQKDGYEHYVVLEVDGIRVGSFALPPAPSELTDNCMTVSLESFLANEGQNLIRESLGEAVLSEIIEEVKKRMGSPA